MKKDPLTELLNQLVAICGTSGRGTYAQLARHLGKTRQQIVSWLTLRDHAPSARIVMDMQRWEVYKRNEISQRGLGDEYAKQFKIACLKFPLKGSR